MLQRALKFPRHPVFDQTVWRSPPNRGFGLSEGSGGWGVGQGCNCQHMLSAIASLIRTQRCEIALLLLEEAFSEHR